MAQERVNVNLRDVEGSLISSFWADVNNGVLDFTVGVANNASNITPHGEETARDAFCPTCEAVSLSVDCEFCGDALMERRIP